MLYQVYSLTPAEVQLVNGLNEDRDRVRLKIESTKDGLMVDATRLQDVKFDAYLVAVDSVDVAKVVEVPAKGMEAAKSLYAVSQEEVQVIEAINHKRSNTMMIVCDYGAVTGVDPVSLQTKEFALYLDLLGGFDPKKVVEVDLKSPFEIAPKEEEARI